MRRAAGKIQRFGHEVMGTCFELMIAGKEEKYCREVSAAVFSEIDRLERLLSRFDPSSEISQINRLRPGESLRIGLEVYECLETAARVGAETKGAFDINYRALVDLKEGVGRGAGKRRRTVIKWLELSAPAGGYVVTAPTGRRGEKRVPLDLDLGAIGKGYALDKLLAVLEDWSVGQALLHSGTSTALSLGCPPGDRRGRGWPVGVGAGLKCRNAPVKFFLKNRALSGSGTEVKGQHIYDPRTGRPSVGHSAAWVSHPSAAVADALSTAFMVMDTAAANAFCRSHPDVWALVVTGPRSCKIFNPKALG